MRRSRERGQTLIFFALASAVVFGMVALAVDVGMMYANRRHAQNVADQAALIGAQRLPEHPAGAISDAKTYALNKLNNSLGGPALTVNAYVGPQTGLYKGNARYIEVTVDDDMPVLFAGVIGQGPTVPISARAVATNDVNSSGAPALLALRDDPNAIKLNGDSELLVTGGAWSNGGFVVGGHSTVGVTGTVGSVAGGVNINGNPTFVTPPYSSTPGDPVDDPLLTHARPYTGSLSGAVKWEPVGGTGNWSGWTVVEPTCFGSYGTVSCSTPTGPVYSKIDVKNNDKVIFKPGIYVVTGDISINGDAVGWSNTDLAPWSDFTDATAHAWDKAGKPQFGAVSFYQPNGGQFTVGTKARMRFDTNFDFFDHVSIWTNSGSNNAFSMTAQSVVLFRGTVYAPNGVVSINGGSGAPVVEGQVIADVINVNGGSGPSAVTYNGSFTPSEKRPRLVE